MPFININHSSLPCSMFSALNSALHHYCCSTPPILRCSGSTHGGLLEGYATRCPCTSPERLNCGPAASQSAGPHPTASPVFPSLARWLVPNSPWGDAMRPCWGSALAYHSNVFITRVISLLSTLSRNLCLALVLCTKDCCFFDFFFCSLIYDLGCVYVYTWTDR